MTEQTTPPWVGELHEVAAHIFSLRDALRRVREIDPEAEEWGRLTVAAELVVSTAHSLAELSPPSASVVEAWEEGAVATTIPPVDERGALLDVLLPRMEEALGEALTDLSIPELRALSSHPDNAAALVLLAGLAGYAEAPAALDAAAGTEAPLADALP